MYYYILTRPIGYMSYNLQLYHNLCAIMHSLKKIFFDVSIVFNIVISSFRFPSFMRHGCHVSVLYSTRLLVSKLATLYKHGRLLIFLIIAATCGSLSDRPRCGLT